MNLQKIESTKLLVLFEDVKRKLPDTDESLYTGVVAGYSNPIRDQDFLSLKHKLIEGIKQVCEIYGKVEISTIMANAMAESFYKNFKSLGVNEINLAFELWSLKGGKDSDNLYLSFNLNSFNKILNFYNKKRLEVLSAYHQTKHDNQEKEFAEKKRIEGIEKLEKAIEELFNNGVNMWSDVPSWFVDVCIKKNCQVQLSKKEGLEIWEWAKPIAEAQSKNENGIKLFDAESLARGIARREQIFRYWDKVKSNYKKLKNE